MQKNAIVLLAEGFEEVEAITPIDYLRRAGIAVTIAAIGDAAIGGTANSGTLPVKGARGITVTADVLLKDISGQWDAVIIPGGMPGAANIAASNEAGKLITEMAKAGKLVCAICASPAIVLSPLGLLSGRQFTCYPGMEERVSDAQWTADRVAIDGNIITSRGAGTAGVFAVAIINELLGEGEGEKIAQSVLL